MLCEHQWVRLVGVGIGLVLLASACSGRFVRSNTTPAPLTTKSVGTAFANDLTKQSAQPSATKGAKAAPGGPLFVLTVTDKHGIHPPGIPVQITGAFTGTRVTDNNGQITLTTPGVYTFKVATGCQGNLQIFGGASGTAGVTNNQPSSGELRIDWRHRYVPAPPVFSSPGPPWPIGGNTIMQFAVLDRCANDFAPNASIATFVLKTSTNLREVSGPRPTSDAKHQDSVTVECLYKGDVSMVLYDRYNPSDSFDLAKELSDFDQPRCG
jgi:hypothetical protein